MRITKLSRSAAICIFHSPQRWALMNLSSSLEELNANAVPRLGFRSAFGTSRLNMLCDNPER